MLAMGDLTPATLRAILAEWSGRDLRREARLSDLTLLYQAVGQPTYESALGYALEASTD